jgi:hypothetical protein
VLEVSIALKPKVKKDRITDSRNGYTPLLSVKEKVSTLVVWEK